LRCVISVRRRYQVILNENAGICAQVPDLEARLRRALGEGEDAKVQVVRSRTPEEAIRAAAHARRCEMDAVVAVGGDGTHHWLVDALAGGDTPLALVPLGTANDLAENYGIPRDLEAACAVIRAGSRTRIDLIEAEKKCFATAGGMGLATDVALGVCEMRRRSRLFHWLMRKVGGWIYPLYMVLTVLLSRRIGYRWGVEEVDGRERSVDGFMALCMNQSFLGKNFKVVPDASNRDGAFDLLLVKRRPRLARLHLLSALSACMRGRHIGRPDVEVVRARRLVLTTPRPARFFADGELVAEATRIEFQVRPRALPLLVPASHADAEARRRSPARRQRAA
jgi:YegS/Rv2252/BmrU family lipid kinase